jgi:hypothetical protein
MLQSFNNSLGRDVKIEDLVTLVYSQEDMNALFNNEIHETEVKFKFHDMLQNYEGLSKI